VLAVLPISFVANTMVLPISVLKYFHRVGYSTLMEFCLMVGVPIILLSIMHAVESPLLACCTDAHMTHEHYHHHKEDISFLTGDNCSTNTALPDLLMCNSWLSKSS